MTVQRESNGRFGAGTSGNLAGRPKKTPEQLEHEAALRVIDQQAPILLAKAFDRVDRGETDLMGPALTVLGAILVARNLVESDRQRADERELVELQFACANAGTATTH